MGAGPLGSAGGNSGSRVFDRGTGGRENRALAGSGRAAIAHEDAAGRPRLGIESGDRTGGTLGRQGRSDAGCAWLCSPPSSGWRRSVQHLPSPRTGGAWSIDRNWDRAVPPQSRRRKTRTDSWEFFVYICSSIPTIARAGRLGSVSSTGEDSMNPYRKSLISRVLLNTAPWLAAGTLLAAGPSTRSAARLGRWGDAPGSRGLFGKPLNLDVAWMES
jgi:hypothetical protein